MTKYISRAILLSFITFFGIEAQNTYSPYSSLGLGEIVSSDYARTAGMAGVGIAMRENTYLNTSNPAGLAAIDSTTGIFDIGVYAKAYNYKSNSYNNNAFNANLNKIALGFRANKFWSLSVGIKPYSNVGYHISNEAPIEGANATQTIFLEGDGGLYNLYMMNAIKVNEHFSLGVMTSMIAGSFSNRELRESYSYETTSRLTSIYNKVGVQYQFGSKIGNWVIGATYGYKQSIPVKNLFEVKQGTFVQSSERVRTTNQFFPESYGLGVSLKKEKLLFAVDGEWERWSGLNSGVSNIGIGDAYRLKAGLGYTPYKDLYTAHLAKQYQFGVIVNKSYIELRNSAAWNGAITTGISFPLKSGQMQKGILNIGLEYGRNLTAPSGYLKENYLMLNINFSFIEAMFMRSKIY